MDKELNDFFKKIKEEDQKQTIPHFETIYPEKPKVSFSRYAIPIGIAAIVLLLLLPLLIKTNDQAVSANAAVTEITISLEVPSQNNENESIYEWESDSSFLINDINE